MIGISLRDILHTIGQDILNPCMAVLLLMISITMVQIGDLLVEYLMERRRMKEDVPELLKAVNRAGRKEPCKSSRKANCLSARNSLPGNWQRRAI